MSGPGGPAPGRDPVRSRTGTGAPPRWWGPRGRPRKRDPRGRTLRWGPVGAAGREGAPGGATGGATGKRFPSRRVVSPASPPGGSGVRGRSSPWSRPPPPWRGRARPGPCGSAGAVPPSRVRSDGGRCGGGSSPIGWSSKGAPFVGTPFPAVSPPVGASGPRRAPPAVPGAPVSAGSAAPASPGRARRSPVGPRHPGPSCGRLHPPVARDAPGAGGPSGGTRRHGRGSRRRRGAGPGDRPPAAGVAGAGDAVAPEPVRTGRCGARGHGGRRDYRADGGNGWRCACVTCSSSSSGRVSSRWFRTEAVRALPWAGAQALRRFPLSQAGPGRRHGYNCVGKREDRVASAHE